MKINGQLVTPNEEILVLPRLEGDIIIKAKAATITDEFNALVPEPTPPGIRTKEGFKPDTEDETYRTMVAKRSEQRFSFLVLVSLEPSNIEWDKVTLSDPTTWNGWMLELRDGGISEMEINRIINCVMVANSLDEAKLKEARESFLLGQVE